MGRAELLGPRLVSVFGRERACLYSDTPSKASTLRTLAAREVLCECQCVITGLAHTGVCVPDCEAAVAFYRDVLGLHVLSPPYVINSDALHDDMGELLADPSMKAAIVGFEADGDRVFEVIEYLNADDGGHGARAGLADHGLSHVALICDDIDNTRAELENKGVRFLVEGIADLVGVRTTWFADPWGVVFILVEKGKPDRPYFKQWD